MLRKFNMVLALALISAFSVYGQIGTGKLKGKIKDKTNGEELPFVNLVLESNGAQKAGGTTDFDGNFIISSIPPGTYDVKVSFVGYKPQKITGVVVKGDKIAFLNIELESTDIVLEDFEVVEYTVPLIDKDGGASGGTVTREDIAKMPGRSATSIATTVGGVYQDAGGGGALSVRGSRSDATYYYIDGIKVRGTTSLPKSAIEEVSVITGGLPANYGDATGGIISITTRGPSAKFFGGIEGVTSGFKIGDNTVGLDPYGYNLVEGIISGPLLMKKDSAGNKTKPIFGFLVSAMFNHQVDSRPSAIGNWKLKDSSRDALLSNPIRPTGSGSGVFYETDFLRADDFENVKWRQNAASQRLSMSGKIDVNTAPTVNLTFGGQVDYFEGSNYSYNNSVFNYENNSVSDVLTWRAYGRFTQRFNQVVSEDSENSSLIKNAYYTVMVDYSKNKQVTENAKHGTNFFNYGYVGKFKTYTQNSYEFDNDLQQFIHNGWDDTLVTFEASEVNADLAAITTDYYGTYSDPVENYENLTQILNGNALLNGMSPNSVYGIWNNVGSQAASYSKTDNTQFRVTAAGSADIGDHAVSLGFEYEQRNDRFFGLGGLVGSGTANIWQLMRQLTNNHILELDLADPTVQFFGTYQFYTYDRLNAAPGEYDGDDAQYFFDYNLRKAMGYDPDGTDVIQVDALDPRTFSLDFFSADELLNAGSQYVNYYGYDHTGEKLTDKPSFDDFFNKKDEFGNNTRPVGAFEPIYISGYIMDKFAFDDLIFNVGIRVDRFDANQMVLKDPWLLHEAKTVAEVDALAEFNKEHPTNMNSDYTVYVNDINDPTSINGYRRLNDDGTSTWFNSDGIEITDPSEVETPGGIAPYLVGNAGEEVNSSAFRDYEPQITVMPRIAFSFPISDEALFFAHYDVLSKRPTSGNRLNPFDYLYMQNRSVIVNNPDLKPEKTIDYELGFQQVLSKSSSLKISAFYREQRDQVALINITGAYPRTYSSWGNIDFGTVKGFTATYDLRKTGNLRLNASYTLQFAEGTGSDATSALNLVNSGQPNLRTIFPYNYDQRHAITATVDYRYGDGSDYDGPVWFGKPIFQNTGVNFVTRLGSGTPYSSQSNITPEATLVGTQAVLDGTPNGSRKPWQFRIDAQVDRNIMLKFGKDEDNPKTANLNIYLLVNNLFNTQNIVSVYRATGNPDDDGYLAAAQFQNVIQQQNDEESYRELYNMKVNNPFNYGIPRTIRLGVKLDF
jgi:hypothetical protein